MSLSIRVAVPDDVPAVVRVHQSAFPGFLLTQLGSRFLIRLYRGFVTERSGRLLIAEDSVDGIVALLAGTSAPADFFRRMRRRHGVSMAVAALPELLRHPLRVGERLFTAMRYRGDRPVALPNYWLLSSLGVSAARAGSGIGAALVTRFCEEAVREAAPGVYLLTDQDNNETTQRFYARHGFTTHSAQHRRDGRRLVVLARSFSK